MIVMMVAFMRCASCVWRRGAVNLRLSALAGPLSAVFTLSDHISAGKQAGIAFPCDPMGPPRARRPDNGLHVPHLHEHRADLTMRQAQNLRARRGREWQEREVEEDHGAGADVRRLHGGDPARDASRLSMLRRVDPPASRCGICSCGINFSPCGFCTRFAGFFLPLQSESATVAEMLRRASGLNYAADPAA
jgi:hypothetical protein